MANFAMFLSGGGDAFAGRHDFEDAELADLADAMAEIPGPKSSPSYRARRRFSPLPQGLGRLNLKDDDPFLVRMFDATRGSTWRQKFPSILPPSSARFPTG